MALNLDKVFATDLHVITVFCYAALGLLASIIGVAMAKMGKMQSTYHCS
jgi:K(+)-stimulated pyrophosphate-energized sodium pump